MSLLHRELILVAMFVIAVLLSLPAAAQRTVLPARDASSPTFQLEFKQARLVDVIRVLAEQSGANIIATEAARQKTVTVFLQNVTVREAVEAICRINGLWFRRDGDGGTFRIMTVEEYRQDLVVYKEDEVKVFRMLNPNTRIAAQAIQDLYGQRVILSLGLPPGQEQNFVQAGGQAGGRNGGANRQGFNQNNQGFGNRRNQQGSAFGNNRNNNQFGAGGPGRGAFGAGVGGAGNFTDPEARVNEELSVDQIEAVARDSTRVSAAALQDYTIQASPIYVTVNNEHNMLIVRSSDADAVNAIGSLVEAFDEPVPQVLLEMKVLDILVDDNYRSLLNLAIDAGRSDRTDAGGNPLPRNSFLLGNFPLEGGTLLYEFISDSVRGVLELLVSDNRINVLSKPILLASNNRGAELFVGEETVITTGVNSDVVVNQTAATAFLNPQTEVRSVGNQITVTPFINQDDTITLALTQESSSVNPNGATVIVPDGAGGVAEVPIDTVNTATLSGTIVAKHGYTMAVGGLIRQTKLNRQQKVPVLGDIPVIGTVFRREQQADEHRELVLLITPYIMRKGEELTEVTKDRIIDPSRYNDWEIGENASTVPLRPKQKAPGTIAEDLRIFENNPIQPKPEHGKRNQPDRAVHQLRPY